MSHKFWVANQEVVAAATFDQYAQHLSWCKKQQQMPLSKTYFSVITMGGPNDTYQLWRDTQPCTCGLTGDSLVKGATHG